MWPVFGGGQCTRYNISVLYLCLIRERQNEKSGWIFCDSLRLQVCFTKSCWPVACKPAFYTFYATTEVNATRFHHISRVMKDLHWLPVKYRIMFKLVVYTFKALHGSAPTYIHQLIRLKPQSNYNLRSNTKHLLLDLPNKTKKTTGDRAFFAAAPTLWNALPDELRALGSLKTFMARLKTHYFKLAFSL